MNTDNIIEAVTNLKARGQDFLTIPSTYYKNLRERLKTAKIKVIEDLDVVTVSLYYVEIVKSRSGIVCQFRMPLD